jgi:hypothetical protein
VKPKCAGKCADVIGIGKHYHSSMIFVVEVGGSLERRIMNLIALNFYLT